MAKSMYPQDVQMQILNGTRQISSHYYDHVEAYQAPPPLPRKSLMAVPSITDAKKSIVNHNGVDHQLIPVEIEKEAELGLIIGSVEGDPWIFIDEILPNGMIDMHGTLKEGDYLIQVGMYSLIGVDVPTALLLIEKAYDEGRKTISFTAARAEVTKRGKAKNETLPVQTQSSGYDGQQKLQIITPVEVTEKRSTPTHQPRTTTNQRPSATRTKSYPRQPVKQDTEDDTTQF